MSKTIVSLDIASSKVVCLIAQLDKNGSLFIKGASLLGSNGIQNGNVINTKLATQTILKTISKAEKMINKNVDEVSININGDKLQSKTLTIKQNFKTNKTINRSMLASISEEFVEELNKNEKKAIHLVPIEFNLDNVRTINPFGTHAKNMEAKFYVLYADRNKVENISECFKKITISVKNVIFDGFASALSVLNEYEMENGVLTIDIGAGNSSFSVINNNRFIFGTSIPIAGDTITNDIASVIGVSYAIAEKVKVTNANLYLDHVEENEMIKIDIDNEESFRASENKKKIINDIFRSRIEEIIELIFGILNKKDLLGSFGSVVITGGTANVPGLDNYIAKIFGIKTRIGRPENFEVSQGINDNEIRDPSYATSIGILKFVKFYNEKKHFEEYRDGIGGMIGKIADFLKRIFTS